MDSRSEFVPLFAVYLGKPLTSLRSFHLVNAELFSEEAPLVAVLLILRWHKATL
jgi:hypothetical protein